MKYLIAIDIGGTTTRIALIRNSQILKKLKFLTDKNSKSRLIKNIEKYVDVVSTNINNNLIKAIVVGIASPVDEKIGIVIFAPNIHGLNNINLKKILKKRFHLPVFIFNDVKLQALGEYSINQNINSLFCLNIGTGVGASFVYNGKAFSTEFGHTIIVPNGEKCTCGNLGCLEAYVSGHALTTRFYKKYKIMLRPSQILESAKRGNKKAKKFLKETAYYLGIGLTNIINTFNPERISIFGGLSDIINYILKDAKKIIYNNKIINYKGKIFVSELNDDALFYGAIYIQGSSAVGP